MSQSNIAVNYARIVHVSGDPRVNSWASRSRSPDEVVLPIEQFIVGDLRSTSHEPKTIPPWHYGMQGCESLACQ
jgi:hypothetical protein